MQKVTIKVPLRIHFNLIAMHECPFRKNGGFGLSVDTGLILTATKSKSIMFKNCPKNLQNTLNKITTKLKKIKIALSLEYGIEISLLNPPVPHIGLGSGTALTLSSIEALLLINRYKHDKSKIQILSERGGTSGVGVHSYFTGGFVLDSGIKSDATPHLPSSSSIPNSLPTLLIRQNYPFGNIKYLYPNTKHNNHNLHEVNFFNTTTPIPKQDSYEACYNSVFMATSSLIDNNFVDFTSAIDQIRKTRWKKSEILHSGKNTTEILTTLTNVGIKGLGMSSMGPGIYILSNQLDNKLDEIKEKYSLNEMLLTPNNSGRELIYA